MPKISVIVPVYKVEAYLRRCVDSILSQTFSDFELILVDDGSPDNCPAICEEYAAKDQRIHVIHQKNGGLSAARNAGIDWAFANSDSKYLTFVDSDDWIHKEMLARLLQTIKAYPVSISVCGYVQTQGEEPESPANAHPTLWDAADFFVKRNINATVAWGKLYAKGCFQEIRYPVGKLHEDEFTTYKILFPAGQVAVIDDLLYFYFVNPNGIMNSDWSPKRLDCVAAREEQIAYFKTAAPRILPDIQLLYRYALTCQIDAIQKSNLPARERKKHIKILRKKKRHALKHYHCGCDYSIKAHPYYYDLACPRMTRYYWMAQEAKKCMKEQGLFTTVKTVVHHFKK